jgi:hypothetical protein
MRGLIPVFLVAAALAGGCVAGSPSAAVPTASGGPGATPAPTASPAPTATCTPAPTVVPTATPAPTITPVPTAIPRPTAVPTEVPTDPPVRPDRVKALEELNANLAKWQAGHPVSYQYTWFTGCFCPESYRGPFRVTVRVDQVLIQPGTPGGAQPGKDVPQRLPIEAVFAAARDALATADAVDVTYDPTYGFPTSVAVDAIKQAVDDEYTITIENFAGL